MIKDYLSSQGLFLLSKIGYLEDNVKLNSFLCPQKYRSVDENFNTFLGQQANDF